MKQKTIVIPQITLNLKQITPTDLEAGWSMPAIGLNKYKYLYARCNKEGDINWKTTLIYTPEELFNKKINIIN